MLNPENGLLPCGVYVALATPADEGGDLDEAGLDRLPDHLYRELTADLARLFPSLGNRV